MDERERKRVRVKAINTRKALTFGFAVQFNRFIVNVKGMMVELKTTKNRERIE